MIKCVIVDDEPHAIELISSYVAKVPDLQLTFSSTNPIEAFQYVQKNPADLIFLDIHMPELDGIQFIKLMAGKSKIILTTAYSEHALVGYEHDVVDYLLKPILFDRFFKAVNKAIQLVEKRETASVSASDTKEEDYIFVKTETRGKLLKIRLKDISFIEGLGNYVTIHTPQGKIICLITFKELEEKLPPSLFVRVHKSFIVALDKIDMIEGNQVIIGKQPVPIGESYKPKFLEMLSGKIINRGQ